MERCPACDRELTAGERTRMTCPYCGEKLPAGSGREEPDWGGFPGASLEFDPRALDMAAEEFEHGEDAVPESQPAESVPPSADPEQTIADDFFPARRDSVDTSATVHLDPEDDSGTQAHPAQQGGAETPREISDESGLKTVPLDEGPPAADVPAFRFASLEMDEAMLSDAEAAADSQAGGTSEDADRTVFVADETPADEVPAATAELSGPPVGAAGERTVSDTAAPEPPAESQATAEMSEADAKRIAAEASPMTSDELQTLNREWGNAGGARPEMTIKSAADELGSIRDSVTASDTVELLPHRRLRPVGDETIEHPEYELVRILGEGGMGIVWDARQISVDRSVAIKMIKGPYAQAPKQRKKFLAEAVVTGDLDHPNIVPIYDVGRDIHGSLFYAMKHVQGTPWEEVLKQNSLHENLEVLLRVSDAVAFAHSRGIIHRDLKPENVMLGEFGETLVMDWGLSLPTEEYRKADWLEFSKGMGGTPAYMAPEMARGPIDRISKASDIYLLGAILYEIVTGRPPHVGKTVKACLVSAMRNQIAETGQQGELLTVAVKAMATDPAERYATVQDFQAAVREYLSHAESISLTVRAHVDLNSAAESDDYRDYARAVFAFEEAYELWNGNREAEAGITQAKLAYAGSALKKGDYDLGLSLLDSSKPGQRGLCRQLTAARDERQARQERLRVAKRISVMMAAIMFLVITIALVEVSKSRDDARQARDRQEHLRIQAEQDRDAKVEALEEKETARAEAVAAKTRAETEKTRAETEKTRAEGLQAEAEYKAYVAGIGAAAAKIDEGAFDVARDILTQLKQLRSDHRNWEWGRLWHLCELYSKSYGDSGPVDSVAVSPDGTQFVAGSRDRTARIRDLQTGKVLADLPHDGLYVNAVAWSPEGYIATGGSDPHRHYLRLWDPRSIAAGQQAAPMTTFGDSHASDVVSVRFSPDGRWLLSCSYDETARLWDLADVRHPREAFVFAAHDWWVWDAAFAPGFSPGDPQGDNRVVTVGQDGKAIVWILVESEKFGADETRVQQPELSFRQDRVFEGHDGPVYSVDFALVPRDGTTVPTVVTGGYDNRVLLWRPEDVQPYGLDSVFGARPEDRIVTIDKEGKATLWSMVEPNASSSATGPEFVGEAAQQLETIGNNGSRLAWRPREVQPFGLESIAEESGTKWVYREFRGHVNAVQSVAFSKDGRYVVSGGRDNTVWVWGTGDSSRIRLRGHYDAVRDAVFTADGKQVVSAGLDEQVLVWSPGNDEEFRVLQGHSLTGHDDAVLSASFSSDGSHVVTASRDRTARVWDAVDNTQLPVELSEGHEFLVSSAVLYSDPKDTSRSFLLTAAADDTARIWNATEGTESRKLRGTGRNAVAALSADGRWVVTGGDDNTAQLWDLDAVRADPDGYKPQVLRGAIEHHTPVTAAAWSPERNVVATADDNGRVIVWDVTSGAPEQRWSERQQEQRINAITFLPDGSQVMAASFDGTVARFAANDGKALGRLPVGNPVTAIAVCRSGGGLRLVTASDVSSDNTAGQKDETAGFERTSALLVWDPARSEVVSRFDSLRYAVNSISVPPDADSAFIACSDNSVRRLPLIGAGPVETVNLEMSLTALAGAVVSDDGRSIVTLSGSDAMQFDADTGELLMTFRPHGAVASAQFSPDDRRIVTGSWDQSVKIWDPETHRAVERLDQFHNGFINSVAYSPDGRRILTATDDGYARIWDVETKTLVVEFKGHTRPVRCAVFSHDGQWVLTASDDRTARLWNAGTGEQIGEPFAGHEWPVLCVAFSPDGDRFITGSEDNEARVWSISDHTTVARLVGHTAPVTSVAFSIDGLRAFTASRDTTAKVWDVSPDGLKMSDGGLAYNLLTLTGHKRELTSIAVSPDKGHDLLTASRDGTAIIWNASSWKEPTPTTITASDSLSTTTE